MRTKTSIWAASFALGLHLVLLLIFAFTRVPFKPDHEAGLLRMQMQEELLLEQKVIEEVKIPANYKESGLEQREYSVAQTNKAVNQALDNLSQGEREAIDRMVESELQSAVKDASGNQAGMTGQWGMAGQVGNAEKTPAKKKKAGVKKGKKGPGNTHDKRTNVEFYLKNRTEGILGIKNPVYLCDAGGTIVVNIAVNRFGDVLSARINKTKSESKDPCLIDAAIQAARLSTFNEDDNAEDRQYGTITYRFMAQ